MFRVNPACVFRSKCILKEQRRHLSGVLCRRPFVFVLQMLSLLEHMYHELGLVKEFNMNKVTLKRWLVSIWSRVADHVWLVTHD